MRRKSFDCRIVRPSDAADRQMVAMQLLGHRKSIGDPPSSETALACVSCAGKLVSIYESARARGVFEDVSPLSPFHVGALSWLARSSSWRFSSRPRRWSSACSMPDPQSPFLGSLLRSSTAWSGRCASSRWQRRREQPSSSAWTVDLTVRRSGYIAHRFLLSAREFLRHVQAKVVQDSVRFATGPEVLTRQSAGLARGRCADPCRQSRTRSRPSSSQMGRRTRPRPPPPASLPIPSSQVSLTLKRSPPGVGAEPAWTFRRPRCWLRGSRDHRLLTFACDLCIGRLW